MFTDIGISKELTDSFRSQQNGPVTGADVIGNVDFSALVLCAGSWPLQQTISSIALSPEACFTCPAASPVSRFALIPV